MISESAYWKEPLLKMAQRLRKFQTSGRLSERQCVQIERDIFIGFYSVRRLFEATTKVSDETKSMVVEVTRYANVRHVTWRNNHRIDKLYDLSASTKETRSVRFVCGRIIHSFVFSTLEDDSGLAGILFTSDNDKDKCLYEMQTADIVAIFERVGNDYPASLEYHVDPNTGGERVIVR